MKMPNPDVGVRELSGLAADPTGGLLLVGEDASGALLRSLRPRFEAVVATTVMNPLHGATSLHGNPSRTAALRRRAASRHSGRASHRISRAAAPRRGDACQGPWHHRSHRRTGSLARNDRCLLLPRQSALGVAGIRVPANGWLPVTSPSSGRLDRPPSFARSPHGFEVVPFGYDPNWFPISDAGGERHGVAFLGTWSPRRERFIAALSELPVTVAGYGWAENSTIGGTPIVESDAGAVLRNAAIGINLLHPQCAEAHPRDLIEWCTSDHRARNRRDLTS